MRCAKLSSSPNPTIPQFPQQPNSVWEHCPVSRTSSGRRLNGYAVTIRLVTAAELLALLAKRYQPSSIGVEMAAEAAALGKDRTVVKERKVQKYTKRSTGSRHPWLARGR